MITWRQYLLHCIRIALFLIIATLASLIYMKVEISIENFANQLISISVSYAISLVANVQPVF